MATSPSQPAALDPGSYAPAGYCPHCGYQIDPGRCTECGREVPRPLKRHPRVRRRRRQLVIAGLALLLCADGVLAWNYGERLARAYCPNAVLAWVKRCDRVGAEWAHRELSARFSVACQQHEAHAAAVKKAFESSSDWAIGQDWLGEYRLTRLFMFSGSTLRLSGSECLWETVWGLQQGFALAGRVKAASEDSLAIVFDAPSDLVRPYAFCIDTDFTIVRWGDWRYLVMTGRMVEFCNDVNAGEHLGTWHFTRIPSQKTRREWHATRPETDALPIVPKQYRSLLLAQPIEARIMAAEPMTIREGPLVCMLTMKTDETVMAMRLRLDAGRNQGVQRGMRFNATGSRSQGMAHVVSCGDDSCSAVWIEVFKKKATPTAPGVGDRVSTRAVLARQGTAVPPKEAVSPVDIAASRSGSFPVWIARELSVQFLPK